MANREELAIIRAARAGQAAAQLALGKRYLFGGGGLPQSMPTALHWLDRAARQHEPEAWILIGSHIPYDAALRAADTASLWVWYERAFDAGVLQAGVALAHLVLPQPDLPAYDGLRRKALRALETAAHAGMADAQWLLAQNSGNEQAAGMLPVPNAPLALVAAVVDDAPNWTTRAADSGVMQAQQALAEQAWAHADWEVFLRWALPLAREVAQSHARPVEVDEVPNLALRRLREEDVTLLLRCAQALSCTTAFDADEVQHFWELAAHADDKSAQLSLGLWYAKMDVEGHRVHLGSGSANYKKAIRWLMQAGERGLADAWYALSRIYLKPEFSQRSLPDAQAYLERAAEMGHGAAQLECGASAWRTRRDDAANDVKAVYWLQKAIAQGSAPAAELLAKIAAPAVAAAWAQDALQQLTREMSNAHPFLAARIELAAIFGLSRAEALLLDLKAADCEHCLLVDIRDQYARSKRRLILLQTGEQRQALHRIARLFEDVDCGPDGPEGNYRQRLYRFKTLLQHAAQDGVQLAD